MISLEGLMTLALAAGTVCPADIEGIPLSHDAPPKELTDAMTSKAVPGVTAATGNVASDSGQGILYPHVGSANNLADSTSTDSALMNFTPINPGHRYATRKSTKINTMNSMLVNSGNFTQVPPKPESSTATAAALAPVKPKLSLKKMPKAEADALAESAGKRRCNRCRAARNLECFKRSTVQYGPLTDTHKSCNKCKLTSIRPVSCRPSLDECGRQYLGERYEHEDVEGNAEEGEEKEAEAMDADGGNQGYETETSLEDYNPED